jgi:tetratricopeptide (TPR) repeat protein
MQQVDTDTTMLPLDVTSELERLERQQRALGEEGPSEPEARARRRARLHLRRAEIYLGLALPELERDALGQLWSAWKQRPGDPDVLLVLEQLLARRGEVTERLRLLLEGARHAEAELAAICLTRAVGLICDEPLASPTANERDHALLPTLADAFEDESVVSLLVQDRPRAARRLIAALREGDEHELAHTLLLRLTVERHDAETFDDALQLASLAEQLQRPEQAFEAYRTALSLRPAAPEALEPTRRHLLANGQFEQLAELLAVSAPAAASPQERATLWRELAALAERELSDRSRAVQAWWRAWEQAQRGDEPGEIKRLYAEEQRWTRYLDVLRQETLRTTDLTRKSEILHELATFQQEVLHDGEGAAKTLEQVLQIDPLDEAALAELVELRVELLAAERGSAAGFEATRRALRRLCDASAPSRRDQVLRRLVSLRRDHGHFDGVLGELERLRPDDRENLRLLDELWEEAEDGAPLSPSRRELARLLLRCSEACKTAEEGSEDDAHVARLRAMARTCDERGEAALARQLRRQLGDDTDDEGPKPRRSAVEGPERLLTRLAEQAAKAQPSDERLATRLLLQAARIGLRHDSTRRTAVSFVLTARDVCPRDAAHELLLLESALLEAERHRELADLWQERVARSDDVGQQLKLLRALAAHQRERLGEPEEAAQTLEQLLALDPLDELAREQVRALHQELGNDAALARLLELTLEGSESTRRIELLEQLGQLYGPDRLDDANAARRTYAELLRLQPHNREALKVVRGQTERAEDPRALAVLLSRAAESDDDPATRAELHREVARIAEQELDDLEFAVGQWRLLIALDPEQTDARQQLRRLLRQTQRWGELEALLLSEVSRQHSAEQSVPLYLELARLAQQELDNSRGAASHLRNARQLAPHDPAVLSELASLHEQLSQWRELASVLEEQAAVESLSTAQRVPLWLRAARVWSDKLGRDEEALRLCQRVRELQPEDAQAAALLAELHGRRGDWKQLAGLLRERIEAEQEPKQLSRLHVEMGQLLLAHFDAPEAAATHLEMALEFDGQSREVLTVLRELYASLGRWDLLVELVRRRALAEGSDKRSRAEAFLEIGEIYRLQLDDEGAARDAYGQALKLDPELQEALEAQRALVTDAGEWREAVTLARRELDTLEHAPDRSRLLVEIARMLDEHLSRPSAAMDALEQALEEDAHNTEALQRLADTTFAEQSWERAVELLTRLCEEVDEQQELHVHFYRLACALEQLGEDDRAFSNYVKSFGREPMYLPTLERLVELCYTRRQWENTLRIAEAILSSYAAEKSAQELADLYLRLGLCELHLAQTTVAVRKLRELALAPGERPKTSEDAWQDVATSWAATPAEPTLIVDVDLKVITRVIKAMEQALARVADHPGALQLLAGLTMARGDWDRALRYLERAADSSDIEAPLRRQLLIAAGDIAAQRLLSTRRAETYYRRAGEGDAGVAQQRLAQLGDRPRTPSTRAPRHAPRSRPRKPRTTPRRTPPPPPPSDDGFDNMRTQPLPMLGGEIELPPAPEMRPLPPKKKS